MPARTTDEMARGCGWRSFGFFLRIGVTLPDFADNDFAKARLDARFAEWARAIICGAS